MHESIVQVAYEDQIIQGVSLENKSKRKSKRLSLKILSSKSLVCMVNKGINPHLRCLLETGLKMKKMPQSPRSRKRNRLPKSCFSDKPLAWKYLVVQF